MSGAGRGESRELEGCVVFNLSEKPFNLKVFKQSLEEIKDSPGYVWSLIDACIIYRQFAAYTLAFKVLEVPLGGDSGAEGGSTPEKNFKNFACLMLDKVLRMPECQEKRLFIGHVTRLMSLDIRDITHAVPPNYEIFSPNAKRIHLLAFLGFFDEIAVMDRRDHAALRERDLYGNNLLHYVVWGWENVSQSKSAILEILMGPLKMDIYAQNQQGVSAVYAALCQGNKDLLTRMANMREGSLYSALPILNNTDEYLIHAAAKHLGNEPDLFKLFLPRDRSLVCLNIKNSESKSVLHILIEQRSYKTALALMINDSDFEIDLSCRNRDGKTVTELLLKDGGDSEERDHLMASMHGHQIAMKIAKADPAEFPLDVDAYAREHGINFKDPSDSAGTELEENKKALEEVLKANMSLGEALKKERAEHGETMQAFLCSQEEIKELKEQVAKLKVNGKANGKDFDKRLSQLKQTLESSHQSSHQLAQAELRQDYEARLLEQQKLGSAQKEQIKSLDQALVAQAKRLAREAEQEKQKTSQSAVKIKKQIEEISTLSKACEALHLENQALKTALEKQAEPKVIPPIVVPAAPLEAGISEILQELRGLKEAGMSSREGMAELRKIIIEISQQKEFLERELAALRAELGRITGEAIFSARGQSLTATAVSSPTTPGLSSLATAFAPSMRTPPNSPGYLPAAAYYPAEYYGGYPSYGPR